jgi:hypothetical protein
MSTLKQKIEKLGGSELLDEIVDDGASRVATRINNEGLSEQIDFLQNQVGMSEDEILATLS